MTNKNIFSIFCQPNEPANIMIYESNGATLDKLIGRAFVENSLFEQHIDTTPRPQLRIVSVNSQTSIHPLRISQDALEVLREKYNIGPELWDLTATFGNKPLIAAAGDGALRVHDGGNGIRDIYKFVFPVTGGPGTGWTVRQIGIFHRHDPKDLQNLWIFFHAGPKTPVQTHIESLVSKPQQSFSPDVTWSSLHQAVLNACLKDWRDYVDFLGGKVDRHFETTLTFIDESMNTKKMADGDGNLAEIYHTRNRLLEIPYRLTTALATLGKLCSLSRELASQSRSKNNNFGQVAESAAYYKGQLEPLIQGVEAIQKKVKDTLNMVEIGLSFRMTSKMLDLNNRMVDLHKNVLHADEQLVSLGNKNFADNATVKVVTIVTLIYLPASLVSSVLGMNLFKFGDGPNGAFTISKQFWIFVTATIILAIITLGGWLLWTRSEEKTRRLSRLSKESSLQGARENIPLDDM